MKRPAQREMPLEQPKAKPEPARFDLPADYGAETDWTPRVVPEDQKEWWDEEAP